MIPNINIGDIAIIKKCSAKDIRVNDIIEFKLENITVVHRVIEIKKEKEDIIFVTKGDNNRENDKNPVKEEDVIGKVIFKIKYLGYPAIWLNIVKAH